MTPTTPTTHQSPRPPTVCIGMHRAAAVCTGHMPRYASGSARDPCSSGHRGQRRHRRYASACIERRRPQSPPPTVFLQRSELVRYITRCAIPIPNEFFRRSVFCQSARFFLSEFRFSLERLCFLSECIPACIPDPEKVCILAPFAPFPNKQNLCNSLEKQPLATRCNTTLTDYESPALTAELQAPVGLGGFFALLAPRGSTPRGQQHKTHDPHMPTNPPQASKAGQPVASRKGGRLRPHRGQPQIQSAQPAPPWGIGSAMKRSCSIPIWRNFMAFRQAP